MHKNSDQDSRSNTISEGRLKYMEDTVLSLDSPILTHDHNVRNLPVLPHVEQHHRHVRAQDHHNPVGSDFQNQGTGDTIVRCGSRLFIHGLATPFPLA